MKTSIIVQPDCGNSPKMELLKKFTIAFPQKDHFAILDQLDQNVRWEMVGQKIIEGKQQAEQELKTMLDGSISELVIENIITHGDAGSVNGTMKFSDGSTFGFCDVYTFSSHARDAKIKTLTSYVVEIK